MRSRNISAAGGFLFERPHHRRIAAILTALDADLLAVNACWFGGGTAMALRYGEYRESVDIDFLVSETKGYRALRERLTSASGMQAIARPGALLEATREVRADQYGIRTLLRTEGIDIKFEIISEGRIALQVPGAADTLCGIATLTPLDMATSKLLANSDRWGDDATMSRDLIDLAMMQPNAALFRAALAKAKGAYGKSVAADLDKAIEALRARPHRLDRCMEAMQMTTLPKALLWKRIKALKGLVP
jgi:nucleotidyltransferase AbiEii toxin of type IV toxin-antitoxin system